jgi:tetratricopeptide (TPR) repeat protein
MTTHERRPKLTHEAQHLHAQAAAYLARSREIAREISSPATKSESLSILGQLNLETGNPEEAEQNYKEAISIAQSIGANRSAADALNGLGGLFLLQGQGLSAGRAYETAIDLYIRIGRQDLAAQARNAMSRFPSEDVY